MDITQLNEQASRKNTGPPCETVSLATVFDFAESHYGTEANAGEVQADGIRAQLENGIIPQEIKERLRYVDLEERSAALFQEEIMSLAERLFPDERLREKGICFFLWDSDTFNGAQIRGSVPPAIGLSRGIFIGDQSAKTEDELAACLAHEVAHQLIQWKYGTKANSKLEEGLADVMSVTALYDAGFSPLAVLELVKRLSPKVEGDEGFLERGLVALNEIVDVHPGWNTRKNVVEAALTQLEVKRGSLDRETTVLDKKSAVYAIATDNRHRSYVDAKCDDAGFSNLSHGQKLLFISDLIRTTDEWNETRIVAVSGLLTELAYEEVGPISENVADLLSCHEADEVEGFYRERASKFTKELSDLETAIFELLDSGKLKHGADSLYRALSEYHHYTGPSLDDFSGFPIGRLCNIADAASDFVQAKTPPEMISAGRKLLAAISSEPMMNSEEGRSFIHKLEWPNFDYPTNIKGEVVTLGWDAHVKACTEGKDSENVILRSLFTLGIADPRVYEIEPEISIAFCTDTEIKKGYRRLSYGPVQYSVNDFGLLDAKFWCGEENRNIDYLQSRFVFKELERTVNELDFDNLGEKLEVLRPALLELCQMADFEPYTDGVLALRAVWIDPELFFKLNPFIIDDAHWQRILVAEFRSKLFDSKDENGPKIRDIFSYLDEHYCFYPGDEGCLLIEDGPLLEFVLNDRDCGFDAAEKWKLVVSSNFLQIVFNHDAAVDIEDFMETAEAILRDTGNAIDVQKMDWEAVTTTLQLESEEFPGQKCLALLQAAVLFDKCEPSTGQLLAFVGATKGCKLPAILDKGLRDFDWYRSLNPSASVADRCSIWRLGYERNAFPNVGVAHSELKDLLEEVEGISGIEERRSAIENLLVLGSYDPRSLLSYRPFYTASRIDRQDSNGTAKRILDPDLRIRAKDIWLTAIRQSVGVDDKSTHFCEIGSSIVSNLTERVPIVDLKEWLNDFANAVESQFELTDIIRDAVPSLNFNSFDLAGRFGLEAEALLSALHTIPVARRVFLEYLLSDGGERSTKWCDHKMRQAVDNVLFVSASKSAIYRERFDKMSTEQSRYQFELIYRNYWTASLEARAVLARELLLPDAEQEDERDAFLYVLEKVLPSGRKYAEEAQHFVKAYIPTLSEYSKWYALSALMVASRRMNQPGQGIGASLSTFLELMGPAETKAGQSGACYLPEEIQRDMQRLKAHAAEPARWEVLEMMKAIDPSELDQYEHIGKILGSASFFISIEVSVGPDQPFVVQLLRPYVQERAELGFGRMIRMLDNFNETSKYAGSIREVLDEATRDVATETNLSLSQYQFDTAGRLYGGTEVILHNGAHGDVRFSFLAPHLFVVGKFYRRIERIDGVHFYEVVRGSHKRDVAKACLALELANILRGEGFDKDRHGGNLKVLEDKVGHFDFGSMVMDKPSDSDLQILGRVIYKSFLGIQTGNDFRDSFSRIVGELRESVGSMPRLINSIQRALLPLEDFRAEISNEELLEILKSCSRFIHPQIKKGMAEAAGAGEIVKLGMRGLMKVFSASEKPTVEVRYTSE